VASAVVGVLAAGMLEVGMLTVGVLAVGMFAVGVLVVGVLVVDVLTVGLLVVDVLTVGVLTVGTLVMGALVVGALAVGTLVVGAEVVGMLVVGVLKVAGAVAVGAVAAAPGFLRSFDICESQIFFSRGRSVGRYLSRGGIFFPAAWVRPDLGSLRSLGPTAPLKSTSTESAHASKFMRQGPRLDYLHAFCAARKTRLLI